MLFTTTGNSVFAASFNTANDSSDNEDGHPPSSSYTTTIQSTSYDLTEHAITGYSDTSGVWHDSTVSWSTIIPLLADRPLTYTVKKASTNRFRLALYASYPHDGDTALVYNNQPNSTSQGTITVPSGLSSDTVYLSIMLLYDDGSVSLSPSDVLNTVCVSTPISITSFTPDTPDIYYDVEFYYTVSFYGGCCFYNGQRVNPKYKAYYQVYGWDRHIQDYEGVLTGNSLIGSVQDEVHRGYMILPPIKAVEDMEILESSTEYDIVKFPATVTLIIEIVDYYYEVSTTPARDTIEEVNGFKAAFAIKSAELA